MGQEQGWLTVAALAQKIGVQTGLVTQWEKTGAILNWEKNCVINKNSVWVFVFEATQTRTANNGFPAR